MSSSATAAAGAAALGAATQELLYWYNLKYNLDQPKYAKLLRSRAYWSIIAAWITASALLSLVVLEEPSARDAFFFGVALPLLIKQIGQAQTSGTTLGGNASAYFALK